MLALQSGTGTDWGREELEIWDLLFRGEVVRGLKWGSKLVAFDRHLNREGTTLARWAAGRGLDVGAARRYMMAAQFFWLDFGDAGADVHLTEWGYQMLNRMPEELGDVVLSAARFLGVPDRCIGDYIRHYEELNCIDHPEASHE